MATPRPSLRWALQTVTTVGHGDVVITTRNGEVIGGIEMVLGISFITFLTAGVTSTAIHRSAAAAKQADREHHEQETQRILDGLAEMRGQIAALGRRLDSIESNVVELSPYDAEPFIRSRPMTPAPQRAQARATAPS